VLWGSSLGATRTVLGHEYTQAEILAATPSECTLAAATGMDGQNTAVLLLPSTNSTNYHRFQLPTGATVGSRTRVNVFWKPNAIVSGQAQNLTMWANVSGTLTQVTFLSQDANGNRPMQASNATGYALRTWKRADGWLQSMIEFIVGVDAFEFHANTTAGTAYVGNGTTGIILDKVSYCAINATAVENYSDTGTATITQTAANAPFLETDLFPEDGWWPDGSQCFRFNGLTAKTLAFSSPAYTSISGTAVPVTLDLAFAPYQTEQANATLYSFTGSTAVLKWEHTTADKFKITRTTDAAVTTAITFDTIVGHVPAIYSVVLDGTSALLYRQGLLVETKALSLAGVTTFTAGAFGGAASVRVAEFCAHSSALTATQVLQVHAALGVRRRVKLDSVPIWLFLGQSNEGANADATKLSDFGAPGKSTEALHCETQTISGWTSQNTGWGPSRLVHHQDWCDSPVPYLGTNSLDVGSQYAYGAAEGFAEIMGRVATIRFFLGGQALYTFIGGGANNAALLAALDAALATLGLPWYLAGVVIVGGETDAQTVARSSEYAANAQTLTSELATRYGGSPVTVLYRLHRKLLAGGGYDFAPEVRAQCDNLAASSATVAVANVDDKPMRSDEIHLGGDVICDTAQTQRYLGQRLAAAALSVTG
jgi:hypothetical protein